MKNKCGHFPRRNYEACNFTVYSTHQHHNACKAELPNHTILESLFVNGSKIVASACWSPLQAGSVGHQKATGQPWQSESALPRCDKSPLSVVVGHSHEQTTHDHWTSLLQDSQPVTNDLAHSGISSETYDCTIRMLQQLFIYHLAYKTERRAMSI